MAKNSYNFVMDHIFAVEGGYVDHPSDPGGATNMGITHRTLAAWLGVKSVSKAAVRALDRATAKAIYRKNYWDKVWGDRLEPGNDLVVMDGAVNSGPSRGVRCLQAAVGVTTDGVMGPLTIAAQASADTAATINRAVDFRLHWLKGLRTWPTFGRGWDRRLRSVRSGALELARRNPKRDAGTVAVGAGTPASQAPEIQDAARDGLGVDPSALGLPGWAVILVVAAAVAALAWWHRAWIAERFARFGDWVGDLGHAFRRARGSTVLTVSEAFGEIRGEIAAAARATNEEEEPAE